MTSLQSEFKFIDRKFRKTLLLIPGWGLDYRTFAGLDLGYNYLLSVLPRTSDFIERAKNAIDSIKAEKVSIFGHSMGGFLAVDFAEKYPAMIDELTLVGIRKRYGLDVLNEVRGNLVKARAAFMYTMYDQSFSPSETDDLSYFKKYLLKSYINEMDADILYEGLDYLEKAEITPARLASFKVSIVHGTEDRVAPISEAEAIAAALPHARFKKVEGGGHILLLRKDINSTLS